MRSPRLLMRLRWCLCPAILLGGLHLGPVESARAEVLLDQDCQHARVSYGAGRFGISRVWSEQVVPDPDHAARLTLFDYL